jgi:hypothetical protein
MTLKDLEQIKEELEHINQSYRKSFSFQARLDLLERVEKLVTALKGFEGVEGNITDRSSAMTER